MELKEVFEICGGGSAVARACGVSRAATHKWRIMGKLPMSEWTARTQHAKRIAELAQFMGYDVTPLDICPLAGQYMVKPEDEVDA